VETLAREHFTYLNDSAGEVEVILGDARISMEAEWAHAGSQKYDALFVDAFSGDSIPVHLLTLEAFEIYLKHLGPRGVLGVHVSNRYFDLSDPLRTLADKLGLNAMLIRHASTA
jgi:spermidine synthase